MIGVYALAAIGAFCVIGCGVLAWAILKTPDEPVSMVGEPIPKGCDFDRDPEALRRWLAES
jgi:hypothetical protein